jgi:hypothetical protein
VYSNNEVISKLWLTKWMIGLYKELKLKMISYMIFIKMLKNVSNRQENQMLNNFMLDKLHKYYIQSNNLL